MIVLRGIAVAYALALIAGEAYRSWGVARAPMLWIDDVLIGAALITAAVIMHRDKPRRRAFFTGVWGVAVGAIYISAVATFFDPVTVTIGAFTLLQMRILIAVAFAVACACLLASLLVPFSPWPGEGASDASLWRAAQSAAKPKPAAPKPAPKTEIAPDEKPQQAPPRTRNHK